MEQNFHSLAYVQAAGLPEARIGVHSPVLGEAYLIHPYEWGNIWIRGEEIMLAGWLTHAEFRRKARVVNAGARTFLGERTHAKSLSVPVAELNPPGGLFERVREWGKNRYR